MKPTFAALACLAFLASSAFANTPDYALANAGASNGINGVTNALDNIKAGKPVAVSVLTTYMGGSDKADANGEVHLAGSFATKSESTGLFPSASFTRTTFNVTLKVVNGKVVGVVATEEVRHASSHELGDAEHLADASMPTTKSWVYGPADFVAEHRSDLPRTDGKKSPPSIASETGKKNGDDDHSTSSKQEQSVACTTVSPSSPGCP